MASITVYEEKRKEAGLSREGAAEKLEYISKDRLYRIENGATPDPDEVLKMAEVYSCMEICNDYCTGECAIGKSHVPKVNMNIEILSQIVLEMIARLNKIEDCRNRLIEIASDGVIDESEYEDFLNIEQELEKISATVSALQLWVRQMVAKNQDENGVYKRIVETLDKE